MRKRLGSMNGELSKTEIQGMLALLPDSFDAECASAAGIAVFSESRCCC